jgi:hypothetical protein
VRRRGHQGDELRPLAAESGLACARRARSCAAAFPCLAGLSSKSSRRCVKFHGCRDFRSRASAVARSDPHDCRSPTAGHASSVRGGASPGISTRPPHGPSARAETGPCPTRQARKTMQSHQAQSHSAYSAAFRRSPAAPPPMTKRRLASARSRCLSWRGLPLRLPLTPGLRRGSLTLPARALGHSLHKSSAGA